MFNGHLEPIAISKIAGADNGAADAASQVAADRRAMG
jgi:hypothetical protein